MKRISLLSIAMIASLGLILFSSQDDPDSPTKAGGNEKSNEQCFTHAYPYSSTMPIHAFDDL